MFLFWGHRLLELKVHLTGIFNSQKHFLKWKDGAGPRRPEGPGQGGR